MQLDFPVAAASYGSLAEMAAAHKERQARFSAAAIRSEHDEAKPKPVVADIPVFRLDANLSRSRSSCRQNPVKRKFPNIWEIHPTTFNHHVIVWRRYILSQDMAACPDFIISDWSDEKLPILEIVLEVLTYFPGLTVDDLKRSGRGGRDISKARMTAIHAVRSRRPDISYETIGKWFGGRHFTTILHSYRKIEAQRAAA